MSTAALEHLPKAEFDEFLRQHFRILRPGGVGSHVVDLQDHLGGSLNNLRFPERWWESRAMAKSGFYTNRIAARRNLRQGPRLRISRRRDERGALAGAPRCRLPPSRREFRNLPDEELCVAGFTLILRKPPPS